MQAPVGPPSGVPGSTVAGATPGVPGQPGMQGQPGSPPMGPPKGPPTGIDSGKFQQFTGAGNIDAFFQKLATEDLSTLASQITPQQLSEIQARFGGDPKFQQFIQTGQIPEVSVVGVPIGVGSGATAGAAPAVS